MKPSIATSAITATGVAVPGKPSELASPRRNRRQLVIQLVAASVAAPATASILSRTTAAQEATPEGEEHDWCAEVMAAATPAAGAEATPTATANCVAIESYDVYFEPNLVTIPADTPVTIALPNEGQTLHNFAIDEHGNPELPIETIDVDIEPGALESVTIEAPAGEYYFYCNVPGHEAAGMFGYLIVEEGAEISAETATVTPQAGA